MPSHHEHSRNSRTTWRRRNLAGTAAIAASVATVLGGIVATPALAADGDLNFVECLKDTGSLGGTNCLSPTGTDGLDGAFAVTVSPDDRHVYVGGFTDDAIATFSRNDTTGRLSFVELDKDGLGGVDGLDGIRDLTISGDGGFVYATGIIDGAVAVFSRDPASGALSFIEVQKDGVGGVDGMAGATGVTISPDGRNVYVGGFNDDAVAIFSRNQNSGKLTFVSCLEDTGGLSATCPSTGGVDGLKTAWFTTFSPDGRFAYVSGPNDDAIATFSRDPDTGQLAFISCLEDTGGRSATCPSTGGVDGLKNAVFSTMSPDGKFLYVVGEVDNAISVFGRDTTTGALTYLETHKDGVAGVDGLAFALEPGMSPDGKQVYVTSTSDDAVTTFTRNGLTGRLSFDSLKKDGVAGVDGLDSTVGLAVSNDGRHVYSVSQLDDAVATFTRDPDRQAPETLNLTGPGAGTSDGTPTFTFDTDDPQFATFECRVDAGPFEACASPFTTFALADGPHRVVVRAVDTAGNVDQSPAQANFDVQRPVPTGPVGPPGANGTNGANGRDATVKCKVTKKKKAKKVRVTCKVRFSGTSSAQALWTLRHKGKTVDRGIAQVRSERATVRLVNGTLSGPGKYTLRIDGRKAASFVVR